LKIFENNYYPFLEKRTPILRKSILVATSNESLKRPEVIRFQKRLISRYIKPQSANILLLLPCSAKKPYSFSKSHKLFRKQFEGLNNADVLHEIIITSPMGVVPRELELTYPASKYDISVTGDWSEDEKNMVIQLLKDYLRLNDYEKIILHIPSSIKDFLSPIFTNAIETVVDSNPISSHSLEKLHEMLKKITKQSEKVSPDFRKRENLQSLASYQFGNEIAKQLLENTRISGRYPYLKIFHKGTQLGMITKERGLISLTIAGARILAKNNKYWVEIFDDFELIGSVFAPGVKDADEQIRVGDEVIIRKNKSLCGVGVAQMTGSEMIELSYGEAVKMRHRL
jgi:archaeosine synthase